MSISAIIGIVLIWTTVNSLPLWVKISLTVLGGIALLADDRR